MVANVKDVLAAMDMGNRTGSQRSFEVCAGKVRIAMKGILNVILFRAQNKKRRTVEKKEKRGKLEERQSLESSKAWLNLVMFQYLVEGRT